MKENPSYYAVIPANVRYDTNLTANAKLLYGEITALSNEKGYCWASNNYFSNLYNVSKVSISKWVHQLEKLGYVSCEIIHKEGSKEILNRYIRIVNDPSKEKLNTPIKEKFKGNNTNINNTDNNIYTSDFTEFWNSYPNKTGKDKAFASWKNRKPRLDDVMFALSWQKQSEQWADGFIPNPATYLNQGRWKDEPTELLNESDPF